MSAESLWFQPGERVEVHLSDSDRLRLKTDATMLPGKVMGPAPKEGPHLVSVLVDGLEPVQGTRVVNGEPERHQWVADWVYFWNDQITLAP